MKRIVLTVLVFMMLFSCALAENEILAGGGYLKISKKILSGDNTLSLGEHLDVKKNYTILFSCHVKSFSGLRIGHGEKEYSSSYLVLDEKNVTVYSFYESPKKELVKAHGLNIEGDISVKIEVDREKATITLKTDQGEFSFRAPWMGCNGQIYATCIDSIMENCYLCFGCRDIASPVWILGDSYFTLGTKTRIPHYLLEKGNDNWLICGFPGSGAKKQVQSFERLLRMGKPKIAVFALGMNNPDKGAINADWLESVQNFLSLCEQYGVEPVLCTIPSAWGSKSKDSDIKVTRDNSWKTKWVRESGVRYVDFEAAVCEGSGSSWREGMLSSDGIHPTAAGAEALSQRLMMDCPEILSQERDPIFDFGYLFCLE